MRQITQTKYIDLLNKSKVIEADNFGEKVLRLPNGNYMKLFRRKRLFSSALFYPYWLRFVWHASALKRLNILTIGTVIEIVKIPHAKKTAVIYEQLPGQTIKQLLEKNSFDNNLIEKFGEFVALLHKKGIYFSSLHLGNIVLTPEEKFGLIDICDIRFVYFALPLFALKTNIRYFSFSRQGLKLLNNKNKIDIFISAYIKNITKRNRKKIAEFLATQKELVLKSFDEN